MDGLQQLEKTLGRLVRVGREGRGVWQPTGSSWEEMGHLSTS